MAGAISDMVLIVSLDGAFVLLTVEFAIQMVTISR